MSQLRNRERLRSGLLLLEKRKLGKLAKLSEAGLHLAELWELLPRLPELKLLRTELKSSPTELLAEAERNTTTEGCQTEGCARGRSFAEDVLGELESRALRERSQPRPEGTTERTSKTALGNAGKTGGQRVEESHYCWWPP